MEEKIYIYHTAPNQRSVITRKTQSDDIHLYGKCNIEATLTAAKDLSDRAFKMYIRMNLHQDGYSYALSPTATEHETGMSEKRYRLAVQELISKGYLVQHEKHKFIYYFYEYPRKDRGIVGNVDSSRPPDLAGLLGDSDGKEASMQSNEGQHGDERGYRSSDEIQHSITSDKTINNTDNIIIYAPSVSEKNLIQNKNLDYCLDADSDDDSEVIDDLFKDIEEAWAEFAPKQTAKRYTWSELAGKFLDDHGEEPCEEDMPF